MSVTVLIAEDELLIALDIVEELNEAGFDTVGPFASAGQAIEHCLTKTPDCAVLDVRLQDGDCFRLADMLTERQVPIVFHSSHASRRGLKMRYRGAEVCPKPAASAAISRLVESLCRR